MKKRTSFHRFLLCLVSVGVVASCSTVDPVGTTTEDTIDSDSAADAEDGFMCPNGHCLYPCNKESPEVRELRNELCRSQHRVEQLEAKVADLQKDKTPRPKKRGRSRKVATG